MIDIRHNNKEQAMKKIKCYKLLLILSFTFFISATIPVSMATNLFSSPTHAYYKQVLFSESDLPEWTYKGSDSLNFLNNKLAFTESQFLQRATLDKNSVKNSHAYGMEFTMNISQMGNAGDHTRPILMISPRSKDEAFDSQYAVTYYLETLQMGQIVANLYKVKWAIVNTAAPSGMEPLVEGYYIMHENVNYHGRLSIENLENDDVKLDFYVDGPSDPTLDYKPLLSYTDNSIYKIMESSTGPSFGTVGYDDDEWGHNPILSYSNLKLYSIGAFKQRTKELEQYANTWISERILLDRYKDTKFLTNQRIILTTLTGDLELKENASIEDMLFALYAIDTGDYKSVLDKYDDLKSQDLSKGIAADMLYIYRGEPEINLDYTTVLSDINASDIALHSAYQNGDLLTENQNNIVPDSILSRDKFIDLLINLNNTSKRRHVASLTLPDIINTNSIFQRNMPIRLWGQGLSDDTIEITFDNTKYKTLVEDGQWSIELPAMNAGGPYTLIVSDSGSNKVFYNIYIGEVFLVAGQSNAELPLIETKHANSILKKYTDRDAIRFFYNDHLIAASPMDSANGAWFLSEDWVLSTSPAIGTYFADYIKKINQELRGIKIGIIRLTYGGSTIELFMPPEEVKKMIYTQRHQDPLMSGYWNGFMNYVMPYTIKGVLYYQGENSSQLMHSYEPLLRRYINGLREAFKVPNLPIILVQIAGYGDNFYTTDNDSWPKIREVQMRVANTIDNVELVTAIDLVDPDPLEIHPTDKKPIGQRLASVADELIYGNKNYVRSPEVIESTLHEDGYIITVDYIGRALSFIDNGPDDFEIKDEYDHWHPANSRIESSDSIYVWSDEITSPTGVRYAWRNYPSSNYFNTYNLPLLPYNSTVDLYNTDTSHLETNAFQVKSTNHEMHTFDAIENITRLNEFRMIKVLDGNIVKHDFFIYGQLPGDQIRKYKRLIRVITAQGTTESVLKIYNHELEVGDWIRNNSRGWVARKVESIIDKHHIEIAPIPKQEAGDLIERYQYIDTITAE